ncbi:hypothetical protein [Saccharicrinis fermentans]|uniref:Outer membrane protein beta-barrel domain-containing protein n=1 Tax=Saccharicrinis fermentans DSM 9555 = JCM 21142 TaxID=869213 RepID=W7Y528_9BACT|nr:hypothetical protein [Saccharicrinis fermentans]GAF03197.1 hypothetical protein JCM21142_41862 [Saccharicrinis fermentans DSM 9555 = JCM 21142]
MLKIKIVSVFILLGGVIFGQTFRAPLAKGDKQLNMGLGFNTNGLPLYGGVDFAVHDEVTIGPQVNLVLDDDAYMTLGFRGDYHFNRLFEMTREWDVYAGANAGIGIGTDDALELGLQIGGRYYWSNKWGINLEFGGGNTFSTKLGVSMKF